MPTVAPEATATRFGKEDGDASLVGVIFDSGDWEFKCVIVPLAGSSEFCVESGE